MAKVVSLADRKFKKSHAGKVVAACDVLDEEVRRLVFEGDMPPGELFIAIAHRLGTYVSCIELDKDKMCKHLSQIIYRQAMKEG